MNDLLKISSMLFSLLLSMGSPALGSTETKNTQKWRFRVYLDDSEIGYHDFTVTTFGSDQEIRTEAAFNVKFLREVLDVIKTPNVALETSADTSPGVVRPVGRLRRRAGGAGADAA